MEYQIHILEQEAYGAVLRAFQAQSDALTWEKEGLITELRKELRVSDDEHRELLSEVVSDGLIHRIREWRKAPPAQTVHDQLQSPTVSASRKRQKTAHSVQFSTASQQLHPHSISAATQPSLSTKWAPLAIGGRRPQPGQQVLSSPPAMSYQQPHQGLGAHLTNELSQRTCDPLVGRKVMTRYPDNGNFYEAIITDYNPVEGLHALVYDINMPNESLEWIDLKQIPAENIRWIGDDPSISQTGNTGQGLGGNPHNPGRGRGTLRDQPESEVRPSQNGVVKKVWDEIEILHTDTLIEKVEKVVSGSHPDLLELSKAKKMLKEHEQTLIDVIAKLSDACDSGSDVEQQHLRRQSTDGGEQGRNGSSAAGVRAGRVGSYNFARDQITYAGNQDDDVVII